MARFRYQHIKSSVEGKAPTAAQLKVAEIGVNDFAGDEKLFIKNSESDVVDFPRGYSREYIDEIDRVTAEALIDLNERKLDASAYTPTDLSNYYTKDETSGATEIQDVLDEKQNVLVSGTNIKTINNESILGEGNITISGTVDQVLDETTSASTNAIATQAVYGPIADLSGQSETVAAALVDLNSEHETIAAALVDLNSEHETIAAALVDLNSEHETIAYSLVDLNNRILEISGNTPSINIDQVIDSTTSASTGAVSTSAVYGFVTSYTPSITVDQVLDNTKSASTNPVSSKAVYDVIVENEEIVSAALTELNDNKLDVSAYTPTDLSNYYTKSETSGATEISTALAGKVDTATFTGHTADTTVHHTSTSAVTSGSTDVIESGGVYAQLDGIKLKKITQSDYDQLQTKDPNTLYIITD